MSNTYTLLLKFTAGVILLSQECRTYLAQLEQHKMRLTKRSMKISSMKIMIPPCMSDLDSIRLEHSILASVRDGVKDHLLGARQLQIVIAKDILGTLASSSQVHKKGGGSIVGCGQVKHSQSWQQEALLEWWPRCFWLH